MKKHFSSDGNVWELRILKITTNIYIPEQISSDLHFIGRFCQFCRGQFRLWFYDLHWNWGARWPSSLNLYLKSFLILISIFNFKSKIRQINSLNFWKKNFKSINFVNRFWYLFCVRFFSLQLKGEGQDVSVRCIQHSPIENVLTDCYYPFFKN